MRTIGALGRDSARLGTSSSINKLHNAHTTSPTDGASEFTDLLGNAMQIRNLLMPRMESRNYLGSHSMNCPQ